VRDQGAHNIVVVDGTQWGQDVGWDDPNPVATANSAILRDGSKLASVSSDVLFSFHVYNQWGLPGSTDEVRDRRLSDFIRRIHAAGHAVVIGELGGGDDPSSVESLATASAFRVAPGLGVGLLAWHGQGVDQNRLVRGDKAATTPADIDRHRPPTNLTREGELLWRLAHR
jgi:hypothetical protein